MRLIGLIVITCNGSLISKIVMEAWGPTVPGVTILLDQHPWYLKEFLVTVTRLESIVISD